MAPPSSPPPGPALHPYPPCLEEGLLASELSSFHFHHTNPDRPDRPKLLLFFVTINHISMLKEDMPQESMSYIKGVFLLVIPKKLKYEKVLKYGTGHPENFQQGDFFDWSYKIV